MQIIFCCFFRYCTACAKNQQKNFFMLHANYFLLIFMCIDIVRKKSTKNYLHLRSFLLVFSMCNKYFSEYQKKKNPSAHANYFLLIFFGTWYSPIDQHLHLGANDENYCAYPPNQV